MISFFYYLINASQKCFFIIYFVSVTVKDINDTFEVEGNILFQQLQSRM